MTAIVADASFMLNDTVFGELCRGDVRLFTTTCGPNVITEDDDDEEEDDSADLGDDDPDINFEFTTGDADIDRFNCDGVAEVEIL
jgi:hypothetical protein